MVISLAESTELEVACMASMFRIRLLSVGIPAAILCATSCAPALAPTPKASAQESPRSQDSRTPNYPWFKEDLGRAEAVVVARLIDARQEPLPDRFEVTADWKLVEAITGHSPSTDFVTRMPFDARGWKTDGPLPAEATPLHRNQNYLLLLSRDIYERGVRARGGSPRTGVLGIGLGYYRLSGDKIIPGSAYETPPDLDGLRSLVGGTS